ncbi:hypothetical protein [Phytohabitans suffuscus]|uniref:hypothetical protein n=1 Tax=Phytohabitans suffuscus TaxID=624315 RepID=UPI0015667596|nr:hypothetical protein [Phytohabitans suffuscus]
MRLGEPPLDLLTAVELEQLVFLFHALRPDLGQERAKSEQCAHDDGDAKRPEWLAHEYENAADDSRAYVKQREREEEVHRPHAPGEPHRTNSYLPRQKGGI